MSDTTPEDQATDLVATHTIVDAARLLGISENAVRKRIRRGTLSALKEGDRWLVALPDQAGDSPSATPDLAAPASDLAADLAEAITPLTTLIERPISRTGSSSWCPARSPRRPSLNLQNRRRRAIRHRVGCWHGCVDGGADRGDTGGFPLRTARAPRR